MRRRRLTLLLVASALLSPTFAHGQSVANPSGHWEGTIEVPEHPVSMHVDLAKNAKGELTGTFTNPAEAEKGLPLSGVAVEGKSVRFTIKGPRGGTFDGVLSDDGKAMSGKFVTGEGRYSIPFSFARTGDARIEPVAAIPAIAKELEGTWIGTLEVNGAQRRIILKLSNHSDATATGSIAESDDGLEIPITAISKKASSVAFEVKSINGSYAGTLNAPATELAGTWTQSATSLPLTFRRDAAR
jgi:hypothetical protein